MTKMSKDQKEEDFVLNVCKYIIYGTSKGPMNLFISTTLKDRIIQNS